MPGSDRLRLDDHEGGSPAGPDLGEPSPQNSAGAGQADTAASNAGSKLSIRPFSRLRSCEKMPASLRLPETQAGGLRHINSLPELWGRSPTCPGIFSQLLSFEFGGIAGIIGWLLDG
jgi:hypothetical protein